MKFLSNPVLVYEYLRMGLSALRAHKFRSALTVLSITIGAFSIVLMSSLAQSGLVTLFRSIEDLGGGRIVMIVPKAPQRAEGKISSYTHGITFSDRDVLWEALPHLVGQSMFANRDRRDVLGDNGVSARPDVVGADGGMLDLFKMRLARGRGFSDEDLARHAKVCVVGHKTAMTVFDGNAIGHTLSTMGVRCHVIGQLAEQDRWGIEFGFDWLDVVVIPLTTLYDVDATIMRGAAMVVKTDDSKHNDTVKRIANALLTDRHHGVDDFELIDFSRFMDKFNQVFSIMRAIVGFVAGIALLVGGVGVMNMMLVSVSERVREIGIRKAIGASPTDIGAQFLWEATLLSGSGGLVGIVAGIGIAVATGPLIRHFKPSWIAVVDQRAAIIALVVSVGIGLFFGIFPARRASKLDAIEAMRR